MPNSSTLKKPRPDFPLFPHRTGRWAKKVRGKFVYFGKVDDDPKGEKAINLWLSQKDDLLAGRVPRKDIGYLRVGELCNQFLAAKRISVETHELSVRTWGDYFATCETVSATLGKNRAVDDLRPSDFQGLRSVLAKRYGPVRLGNEIQRVRTLLKWAYDSEMIEKPIRTGPEFRKPAKHIIRKARNDNGQKMIEPKELCQIIDAAESQMRAMIYLGLNCGLGNTDCGSLRHGHINLRDGWLNFPRPKTGISRRCPLWAETIAALREAIAVRPEPLDPDDFDRVFLSARRKPWTADAKMKDDGGTGPRVDTVTKVFRELLGELQLHRPGISFYALRHIFETVAGGTSDQVAVDCIMGHADHSMAAAYRERVDDARLRLVTDHVRKWLLTGRKKRKAK